MATTNPNEIVKMALAKGELNRLLLAAPEYQYRSKYSPAHGDTDLTELLDVIYLDLEGDEKDAAKEALIVALYSLSGTYEGIDAIATCILYEWGQRSRGKMVLGLPLGDLAEKLQDTVRTFKSRLREDKCGVGRYYEDGLLGNLRRMSHIVEDHGGPRFCD